MKHAKSGFLTIALFALAATLLTFSVVGSSQAALTYFSETYGAEVSMQDIGVTLVENDQTASVDTAAEEYDDISWRDYRDDPEAVNEESKWSKQTGALVQQLTGQTDNALKLGHSYEEHMAVRNSGTIDEYVRVTIYKYWANANGQKTRETAALDPGLIKLSLTLGDGWREDESSRTDERTVLYYDPILPSGDTTPVFSGKLEIDDEGVEAEVYKRVTSTDGDLTTVETYYTYNGMQFVLEVHVDAVQTHNAPDAKMSAWGTQG